MALQAQQRDLQLARHEANVGCVEDVLVDGPSRRRAWEVAGRTGGNTIVNFPGPADWRGRLVPVRITAAAPNSLRGEPAGKPRGFGHAR
jgi:tRNA-2-methylthio-N6-dimethylallyladenosine synthase